MIGVEVGAGAEPWCEADVGVEHAAEDANERGIADAVGIDSKCDSETESQVAVDFEIDLDFETRTGEGLVPGDVPEDAAP